MSKCYCSNVVLEPFFLEIARNLSTSISDSNCLVGHVCCPATKEEEEPARQCSIGTGLRS